MKSSVHSKDETFQNFKSKMNEKSIAILIKPTLIEDGRLERLRVMWSACDENCSMKCEIRISDKIRSDLFAEFWNIDNYPAKVNVFSRSMTLFKKKVVSIITSNLGGKIHVFTNFVST